MSDTYQGDTGYSRGPGSYTQDRTQPYNVVNWIGGQTSKDHYAGAYRKPGMPPVPPEARPYVPPRKVDHNMRQADVLTTHGAPGMHYEPPLVRCFEPNDHVHQNANGIVGKPNTDIWNPCQKPFKVANQSHMHIVPNTMYPQNQDSRAQGYPMPRQSHAGKMTASHLAQINMGFCDPSQRANNMASWLYAKPGVPAYPENYLMAGIRHSEATPRGQLSRQQSYGSYAGGGRDGRGSYAPSRGSYQGGSGSHASSRLTTPGGPPPPAAPPRRGSFNVRYDKLYNDEGAWRSTTKDAYIPPALNLRASSNFVRDSVAAAY